MTTQPKALRLADLLDLAPYSSPLTNDAAEELRRLHQHELANQTWYEKTEWVQQTAQPNELGMHRADVLRQRIDCLHAVNEELLEALKQHVQLHDGDCICQGCAAIAKATGEQA